MRNLGLRFLFLLLFFGSSLKSWSQADTCEKIEQLEDVIIEAPRIKTEGVSSLSGSTLSKEEINKSASQSLASVIEKEEGVTLISKGTNVQLPVIHGLYGNRILILSNGMKHGFQNWGSDHAPEIAVSSANKISIIKGAGGVRFGPEALGGVIIVEPNPLYLNTPFYTELGTRFQSNGRGVSSNFELGNGFKNWSYFIGGSYDRVGDRHAPDYVLTNSGKEEKSINMGARYHNDKWDLKLYYSYINQHLSLLRSSIAESGNAFVNALNADVPTYIRPFSYAINEPNQFIQHHFGKAELNWLYAEDAKLTFRVGQQLNKREEFDVRRNADRPIINLDLITTDYQIEWKHPSWKKLDGMMGVQAFYQNNDNNPGTGTTPLMPNFNTYRYSAFWIESLNLGQTTLEGGVRVDYETNDVRGRETNQDIFRDEFSFNNLTSTLGLIRNISESSTFRVNIGTAWRTPNMAELYSFGQHGFKTSFGLLRYYTNGEGELRTDKVLSMKENPVSPEKGYKFIANYQLQNEKNSYRVTFYSHYIENYIFDRPVAVIGTIRGPMPVFIFDQVDAFFVGTDLSWRRNWTDKLSGTASLSYLWSRNVERGEALIDQPPIMTSYKLTWIQEGLWKFDSFEFGVKPKYTFKQLQAPRTVPADELIDGSVEVTPESEIFDFKDAPNGYFLLDISCRFTLKNFSGGFTIANALNTRYRDYLNEMRYFADELGLNVLLNLNYLIKAKNN